MSRSCGGLEAPRISSEGVFSWFRRSCKTSETDICGVGIRVMVVAV